MIEDDYEPKTPTGLRLEADALEAAAERQYLKADKLRLLARNIEEGGRVILVTFGSSTSYAYLVPTGQPLPGVGDRVVVPPSDYHNRRSGGQVVTVVGYGRGGYTGPLKSIDGYVTEL